MLETDTERGVYLDLLQQGIQRHGVELIGYCLISNHIHLVAVPQSKDALARTLKQTHGRFASYWNAVNRSSGHVWQGRYYSCPLDDTHLRLGMNRIAISKAYARSASLGTSLRLFGQPGGGSVYA
jgi:putative transposase